MTVVDLTGVPETMLWTLHNRAHEALHPRGVLKDDACIEIYRAIPYDYERSFGHAEPSHGLRSAIFDAALRTFLETHPDGVVVNLGEGLETQRFRLDVGPEALWISVDVPEAIAFRERFIQPDATHLHLAMDALDPGWLEEIPEDRALFVTAQGLFMYFEEAEVRGLVRALGRRRQDVQLMFDHIPRWFSLKTTSEKGFYKTPHYRVPPMPWGVNLPEILPTLSRWVPGTELVAYHDYRFPRGLLSLVWNVSLFLPWIRNHMPGMTHVRLGSLP